MVGGGHGESRLTPLLKAQGTVLSSPAFPHPGSAPPFAMDASFSPAVSARNGRSNGFLNNQELCKRCNHYGVDVKLRDCGCCFHARCTPVSEAQNIGECPVCRSPVRSLYLMPMAFDEIDAAKATAATMAPSSKRGKKRKNATIARLNPHIGSGTTEDTAEGADLRTGRWTNEETLYCDKLIEHFETGTLPITQGIKLNDFLSNMLKSKQSRLTKKMKNARLSTKTYKKTSGYIANFEEAKAFSALEQSFYNSIQCDLERAEIRFHMHKEWRELFSSFCVVIGQKLDADAWLSSVEELDRRVSEAMDAARIARRKIMMGFAITQDSMNQEQGVFIDNPEAVEASAHDVSLRLPGNGNAQKKQNTNSARELRGFSSPFVGRVIQYIDRNHLPFEYIDAWVPSFIPNGDQPLAAPDGEEQKCRLCFAGFATTDFKVPADGGRAESMSGQDHFDLLSFGEYSSKFSFDVGCGLPGRVYSSGICSWEQGVVNAPSHQFERCGGALQWGIKTVLGVPIPSPNVGRVVICLYSRYDRPRDTEMVRRLTDELSKLMPTPKWKLVVDVASVEPREDPAGVPLDSRVEKVLKLVNENMPAHRHSPLSAYLPGFEALRQLLTKFEKSHEERELLRTTLDSYSSYVASGRSESEVAWMVARDFMLLSQSTPMGGSQESPSPLLFGRGLSLPGVNSNSLLLPQAAAQQAFQQGLFSGGLIQGQSQNGSALRGGPNQGQNVFGMQSSAFHSASQQRSASRNDG